VAAALAAGVAFGVWFGLDALVGRSLAGQVVAVGGACLAAVSAYLGLARVLRIRELDVLLSLRRRPGTTG
jgi:hypothetical protein